MQVVSSHRHKTTAHVVMVPPTWPGQVHVVVDVAVVAVLSELDGVFALKEEQKGFWRQFCLAPRCIVALQGKATHTSGASFVVATLVKVPVSNIE